MTLEPREAHNEEGTTMTPFDMVVRNGLDRFHFACDVIDRVPRLGYLAALRG
jgi:xylulose-5-phosphate/fructose-6-phosphate phosphoketolase